MNLARDEVWTANPKKFNLINGLNSFLGGSNKYTQCL